MKNVLILTVLVLLCSTSIFADNVINIRGGSIFPSDSKAGFMPGISYGTSVDDIVELAVGFDFYYRNYRETKKDFTFVNEAGNEVTIKSAGTDIKTGYIPLMSTIKIAVPIDHFITPYAGVGLGWAILWENVFIPASQEDGENEKPLDETYFYNGFNWILQLGGKYRLSDNVHLYGESFYNFGKMKRNVEKGKYGVTWDEINMSGLGLRIGVELGIN